MAHEEVDKTEESAAQMRRVSKCLPFEYQSKHIVRKQPRQQLQASHGYCINNKIGLQEELVESG